MHLGESNIACVTQIALAIRLGKAALDTGPQRVLCLEFGCLSSDN